MHFNMFAKSGWLPPPTLSPRKSRPFKPWFVLLEDERMIKPFSKPWCFQASKWKILRVKVEVWHPPKNGFYIGDCFKKKEDVFPWGKQQNTTIWHPPTIMEVETCPIVKENHLEGILFPLPWLWRKSNPVFVVPCICGTNVFHMWVENRRHQSFY